MTAASPVADALRAAAAQLVLVSATARLDAELLLAHALGVERGDLLLDPARFAVPDSYAALLKRRLGREPVAYILGYRDFWTIRLAVGPGALVPRADSELLIETALAVFPDRAAPLTILDLGTGPGTLLLAALSEFGAATGLGIDVSPGALDFARRNAAALGLEGRARFEHGDWTEGLIGRFDLILCNPPYIGEDEALMAEVVEYEPATALRAGTDGLADYRRILPELPRLLAPGGSAIVEIGWTQAASVGGLAAEQGLTATHFRDLGGRDRALLLRRQ